jgi:hypothetical protein
VLNKNFAHGKWWGEEATISKEMSKTHRLSAGAEIRDNIQQNQGNYDLQLSFSILATAESQRYFLFTPRTKFTFVTTSY